MSAPKRTILLLFRILVRLDPENVAVASQGGRAR